MVGHWSNRFSLTLAALHIGLLVFYAYMTEIVTSGHDKGAHLQRYNYLIGITLMMLVGFGYLMTFLRWYGLGAVGLTMMITCLGMELAIAVEPFFKEGGASMAHKIPVDLTALIDGDFAVATFLISFGGLIGKVGPTQLVVLVVMETFAYCAHKQLVLFRYFDVKDAGGTISIHMFGAYYGLAVALVLGTPREMKREKPSIVSDIFSLIGTTFLWLYWPSFAAAECGIGTEEEEIALIQTIFALIGSTVVTFFLSPMLGGGHLRPVDVQNATLAGGVAIGAVVNLKIGAIGALLVGSAAGALSTFGFCKMMEPLAHAGLHDTCGIHNLHGMPSILGALASVIVPIMMPGLENAGKPETQFLCIVATLVSAVGTGLLTGVVLALFRDHNVEMGDDSAYWEVADDFEPQEIPSQAAMPAMPPWMNSDGVQVQKKVFMV